MEQGLRVPEITIIHWTLLNKIFKYLHALTNFTLKISQKTTVTLTYQYDYYDYYDDDDDYYLQSYL